MTPLEFAADLRSRINPSYATQLGTESYERRLCAEVIEELGGMLLWSLWHHQGSKSKIGQPIRKVLGIGQYDTLTYEQVRFASDMVAQIMRPEK